MLVGLDDVLKLELGEQLGHRERLALDAPELGPLAVGPEPGGRGLGLRVGVAAGEARVVDQRDQHPRD
ncbi:MAG: hypothetical protein GWN07_19425, partial [Actinobacteria bacterium]|nr:hypothetical protein [Actinomycetota bacterium]